MRQETSAGQGSGRGDGVRAAVLRAIPGLRPLARAARAGAAPLRPRLWRLAPGAWLRTARWAAAAAAAVRRRRRERRLTVAVDVVSLWEPLTGIGWYLYELLEELAGRDDLALRLYGPTMVRAPGVAEPTVPLPEGPALERVGYEVPDDLVLGQRWLVPLVRRLEPLLLAADRNRVAFAPNYILPPAFRLSRAARVATVHDLSVLRVPWAVRPDTRVAHEERLASTLREARRVIAVSRTGAGELEELAGVAPDRVRVVPHGPGQLAARATAGGDAADGGALQEPDAPAAPPGTPADFGLYVGTLEPRKNVPGLVAAWRELRRRLPAAPALVLVGRYGWGVDEIRRAVDAAAAEGWLVHHGYVSSRELLALYRGARLLALASFYEGFGLPVLEAMSLGTPVVLSDIPVLRELAGDAALYAPPDRPEEFAERLAEAIERPQETAARADRGRRRAGRFTWARAADETAAVLREAAGARP